MERSLSPSQGQLFLCGGRKVTYWYHFKGYKTSKHWLRKNPGLPTAHTHLPLTIECSKGKSTQGWWSKNWNENPDSISYHSSDFSSHSSNQSVIPSSQKLINICVSWPLLLSASCSVHVHKMKFQYLCLGLGFVTNPKGSSSGSFRPHRHKTLVSIVLCFTGHRSLLVLIANEWTRPLLIARSKELY